MKPFQVGCFSVTPLEKGRWKVINTKTTYEHVTYGTAKEVREQLKVQAQKWEERFAGLGKARPRMGNKVRTGVTDI